MASERMNKLFQEFNTLAVVYGMPSDQFIADGYQKVSGGVLCLVFGYLLQLMCFVCIFCKNVSNTFFSNTLFVFSPVSFSSKKKSK